MKFGGELHFGGNRYGLKDFFYLRIFRYLLLQKMLRPRWLYGEYYTTVCDLEPEPLITPAETVVHPVPDAAFTPNLFVCILMETAI